MTDGGWLEPDPPATPEEALLESDRHSAMLEGLATLSQREQRILELHFVQEMTQKAIAKELSLSAPRIAELHRRALRKLRVCGGRFGALLGPPDAPTYKRGLSFPQGDGYRRIFEKAIELGGGGITVATLLPVYLNHSWWELGVQHRQDFVVGLTFQHHDCEEAYLPLVPASPSGWRCLMDEPLTLEPGVKCRCGMAGVIREGDWWSSTH